MKKIIFKLSLLYLFIFLFCSKIYSYDRELIVNEIKNTIESNQDIGKIENILKRFNYKSYSYETKIKKLRLIQSKYPLNTFFLQKKHLLK